MLTNWNKDASSLRTFFLLYDREIFALLINTLANYNTKVKLSNVFPSLCVNDFLSNDSAKLF